MNFSEKNHEHLNKNKRNVSKTSAKFFMCFVMVLMIVALTSSCQKDNLEDAVLPQTAQGDQGITGANGKNGQDGEKGDPGEQGPKGDQGEPGPKGDTGETGPAGANGADGTNGADGEDGSVDLKYTDWFNFVDTNPTSTSFFYSYRQSFSFFNREFIDNGGFVLVYEGWVITPALGRTPIKPSNIVPVPKTDNNGVHKWEVGYRMESNGVDLTLKVISNTSAYGVTRSRFLQDLFHVNNKFYRIIFVPGGQLVSKGISKNTLKKMSYEEVIDQFGIVD